MPTSPEGLFLPTTQLIDVKSVSNNEALDEDLKQVIIRIIQAFNDYAAAINVKDTGIYDLVEFVNGQIFFPNPALNSTTPQPPTFRQVFRIVINFGTLPNNMTKPVAHGLTIDANTSFTAIYATATKPTAPQLAFPIPNTSITGNITYIYVDNTNVNIATNYDATDFTICYVVLEYIKS